jgi:hypothetical protein
MLGDISTSVLARFLELRGRQVVKACGSTWYMVPGRFLMSIPYQAVLNPDRRELSRLIRDARAFGARFPSLTWTGLNSGLYVVFPRTEYNIRSLHIKHRPRVRHASQLFEVRPAEKSELLQQGLDVNRGTMARQGRFDPEFGERSRWARFVEAAFGCAGINFPAVFAGRRLAAYMTTCREEKWLHILHQMSRQEDLPNFPNHLLTYAVTKQASCDSSLEAVCYGCAPLFEADGLHEYKLRFGYELIPYQSSIQLHPALDLMLNKSIVRSGIRGMRRLHPRSQFLEVFQTVLSGARASMPPC